MATLGELQREFTLKIAELILYAYSEGYELTFGDAYRDARVFGGLGIRRGYGRAQSNHKRRLAVDLNLFKDGKWLTRTEDHQFLGTYWETLHPRASWGGHFNDGNHYAFEYGGHR